MNLFARASATPAGDIRSPGTCPTFSLGKPIVRPCPKSGTYLFFLRCQISSHSNEYRIQALSSPAPPAVRLPVRRRARLSYRFLRPGACRRRTRLRGPGSYGVRPMTLRTIVLVLPALHPCYPLLHENLRLLRRLPVFRLQRDPPPPPTSPCSYS